MIIMVATIEMGAEARAESQTRQVAIWKSNTGKGGTIVVSPALRLWAQAVCCSPHARHSPILQNRNHIVWALYWGLHWQSACHECTLVKKHWTRTSPENFTVSIWNITRQFHWNLEANEVNPSLRSALEGLQMADIIISPNFRRYIKSLCISRSEASTILYIIHSKYYIYAQIYTYVHTYMYIIQILHLTRFNYQLSKIPRISETAKLVILNIYTLIWS